MVLIGAEACVVCDQHMSKIPTMSSDILVGLGGLEPPTSPLSGVRSNHLSYRPNLAYPANQQLNQAILHSHAEGFIT